MYAYKNSKKTYLEDQPMLSNMIKGWISSLDLSHDLMQRDVEPLECMSRDGFYAASHNCGGFDLIAFTDLSYCHGSGYSFGMGKQVDKFIKSNLELASDHCKTNNITDDEKRYEVEDEFMTEPVWVGVRCMYEGVDSKGIHTLMVYCGGNISEYYGPFQSGSTTLIEFEIRFKTASGLRRQLSNITNKVQNTFK